MLNSSKIRTHKQSKYFTIMLIPYSSGKTRSIKIPMLAFYVVSCIILVALICVVSFAAATKYFRSAAQSNASNLEKVIADKLDLTREKEKLSLELRDEKANSEKAVKREIQTYEDKIDYYEQKAQELEEKLEELDKAKEEILNQLSQRGYKLEVIQAASTGGETVIAFMSMETSTDDERTLQNLENRYEALMASVEQEMASYDFLMGEVKKIKPYLDNYPNAWPVKGIVTSEHEVRTNPFGGYNTEMHKGIDIDAKMGTNVRATGGGKVTFAGWDSGGYGYMVRINHGYGMETLYAHNSRVMVDVGDYVERGDIVAKSGNTGRSTGPHVHYEVIVNGASLNPRNYIGK